VLSYLTLGAIVPSPDLEVSELKQLLTPFVVLALAVALAVPGRAQSPPSAPPAQTPAQAAAPAPAAAPAAEPAKEPPKPDPKIAEYEKAIRDLRRIEGPFPMYERRRDLLLELSESQLGRLWHMQATAHTGIDPFILTAGSPLGTSGIETFRWDRRDDQIWLVRPNLARRWTNDDPLAVASRRGFPEAILGNFRIEQEHPEKRLLLVNVTSLFHGEVLRLSEMVNAAAGGGFSFDRDRSFVESIRGFPENTVLRMRMHFQSRSGGGENPLAALLQMVFGMGNHLEDPRSAPFTVTYNLWYRQESDYMPRLADPRVGFFTQDFFSVARIGELDRTQRFITRFDLRKKNPAAERSEPVRPIVWTIDHSVPKEHRQAVRDGILMWNRAFDALGYVNAIQVVDAPENDPDYDHADGRRNVVRWIMSEDAGYAVALFRADPLTGQMLNAAVNVDANMVAAAGFEYDLMARPVAGGARAAAKRGLLLPEDPAEESKVNRRIRQACGHDHGDPRLEAFFDAAERLGWRWRRYCSHAAGLSRSAQFAWQAMQAARPGPRISREEYIAQFVRELVAHEIGHTLGLRHNFAASTHLTTAQYADDAIIRQQGVTASVMEYNPVNMASVLRGDGYFFSPVIGAYDMWAIRFGYTCRVASTPEGEVRLLAHITRQSGLPGHAYMTDQDADTFNPFVARWDAGKDPLNMLELNFQAYERARVHAVRNLPRPGQSYADRNRLILMSLRRTLAEGLSAAAFVGGIENNRHFRGDLGERPTLRPVDPAIQRQAMRLIARHSLSVDSASVPDSVLHSLSMDFAGDRASGWTAPVRSLISNLQAAVAGILMSSETTGRIAENAFKAGSRRDVYTISEHYGTLLGAVFSEVGTGRPISATRRDLQAFVLESLVIQAAAPSGRVAPDVRATADAALGRLLARFDAALAKGGLDGQTRDHLTSLRSAVKRYQNRQMTAAN
jgi:hypothetical protein